MAGVVDGDDLGLEVVHRFPNGVVERDGHLRWDLSALFDEVETGLAALVAAHPRRRVDRHRHLGRRLRAPRRRRPPPGRARRLPRRPHRRPSSTTSTPASPPPSSSPDQRAPVPALQHPLPAGRRATRPALGRRRPRRAAARPPGLLAHRRAAHRGDERVHHRPPRRPHRRVVHRAPRPPRTSRPALLPPLEAPGQVRGRDPGRACPSPRSAPTTPPRRSSACPPTTERFAYVASGTWSLVGLELDAPVLTDDARTANFTNERGVDGRTRFLRNVGGLWLLQESLRSWAEDGPRRRCWPRPPPSRPGARRSTSTTTGFIPPGGMPERIAAAADRPRDDARRDRPLHRRLPRRRLRPDRAPGRRARRPRRRGDPRRRRRLPERAALPAHRRPGRTPGDRRARWRRPPSATSSSRPGPTAPRPPSLEAIRARIATATPLRRYDPS